MSALSATLFHKGEGEVWLYGSRARGDFKRDSDWDLLVIVNDEAPFKDTYDKYAYPFVELGWKYKQAIIPVVYTKKEWEAAKNTLFYHSVINDRIRL